MNILALDIIENIKLRKEVNNENIIYFFLQTPVEVTTIEFHPEYPRVVVGGCINGQVITWDIGSLEHRITAGRKPTVAKMPDEEEDKT